MSGFESLIRELHSKSAEFNQKAATSQQRLEEVARTFQQAAEMLVAEREKNAALEQQLSALKISSALKQRQLKQEFKFLIDGSETMTSSSGNNPSPHKAALDGFKAFSSATGMQTRAVVWCDFDRASPLVTEKLDGLNGSKLLPAVKHIGLVLQGAQKPQRFVIVSDGDISDFQDSFEAMRNLLRDSKNVFIDFVVINDKRSTEMERFASKLLIEFPKQAGIHNVKYGESLDDTLAAIVEKAPKAKKAKPSAGPTA
jgi:hypothetical protein